jgi:Photosynthetic reaction centre cytochrome C subunit
MLLVLVPLCAQDAPPPKKGGGRAPKNLKVLTPEELGTGVMAKYVAALGVGQSGGCNYCHVASPGGKDSDDNPKKNVARMMITMVKDINAKVNSAAGGTAKDYVTCYTCHRGKAIPDTDAAAGLPLP